MSDEQWKFFGKTEFQPYQTTYLTAARFGDILHLLCGPYWGCATRKGPLFSPISTAKGLFLARFL